MTLLYLSVLVWVPQDEDTEMKFSWKLSFSLEPWSPGALEYMLSCSTGSTIHQGDQPFHCCFCHSLLTPGPLDGEYNLQWGSSNYLSCSCPEKMGPWAFSSPGKQQLCSRCTCAVNEVWPDAEGLQHSSPSLAPLEVTPPSLHVQIITVASLPFCYLCSSI